MPAGGVVPWLVVDPAGEPVEPILRFLRDFAARDNRAGSVRSYCYALLRWWRWLKVIEVEWDEVTSAEVRDFVLWLGQADCFGGDCGHGQPGHAQAVPGRFLPAADRAAWQRRRAQFL